MKIKSTFKFICILAIILVIYFASILNMNKITVSYDGKIEEYDNPFYTIKSNTDILTNLSIISKGHKSTINANTVYAIKNNKIIMNLLKKHYQKEQSELYEIIDKLVEDYKIKLMENFSFTYLAFIDWTTTTEYPYNSASVGDATDATNAQELNAGGIAFTMDFENIVYREDTIYSQCNNWYNVEIIDGRKEEVYEKITKELDEIGVIEKIKFEPDTVYIKYFNNIFYGWDGFVYVVEDSKNHIKVEYDTQEQEIKYLEIGFENYMSIV